MGHVNNAVYFSYFEQARMHFFSETIGRWDWNTTGIILARNEINYQKPLFLYDQGFVEIWIEKIGGKSFDVCYRVYRKKDDVEEPIANGKSILVCFNYKTGETYPVPDSWRKLMVNDN